ncbi:MAG: nitrogenase component 1 [Methanomassiliicoccales archaeon]|jgi:nitrogenase molybdenum-iron protein beta chain
MSTVIQNPRHYCALGGQQTVVAIERAIPILHSGPGCGVKLFHGLSCQSGYQGAGYAGGSTIPCTNATEREIVFGGEDRLREVIDGSLKVLKGDLFVVLTGCTSDIVGDDVRQVVREYQERGVPIVYAETGGFKGSNLKGHELVVGAIIDQLIGDVRVKKAKGLVNVWSSVPYHDPFWTGNLGQVKRLLEGIGLRVNILFGPESGGVKEWRTVPNAAFNLVLSPWVGLGTAEKLKERYGTPFLHYPVAPIGAKETSRFLRSVEKFAGLDQEKVETFIHQQEKRFYYHIERSADFFVEFRYDLVGRFFNLNDSFYTLGVTNFLLNELGIVPGEQFVTEGTPDEHRDGVRAEFERIVKDLRSELVFEEDSGEIYQRLRGYDLQGHTPLILGSSWDRDIASEMNGFWLNLSLPVMHRLVMDRSYLGYEGGLRLAEDIFGGILETYK